MLWLAAEATFVSPFKEGAVVGLVLKLPTDDASHVTLLDIFPTVRDPATSCIGEAPAWINKGPEDKILGITVVGTSVFRV